MQESNEEFINSNIIRAISICDFDGLRIMLEDFNTARLVSDWTKLIDLTVASSSPSKERVLMLIWLSKARLLEAGIPIKVKTKMPPPPPPPLQFASSSASSPPPFSSTQQQQQQQSVASASPSTAASSSTSSALSPSASKNSKNETKLQAVVSYEQALAIAEKQNLTKEVFNIRCSIASLLNQTNTDNERAISEYTKALKLIESVSDKRSVARQIIETKIRLSQLLISARESFVEASKILNSALYLAETHGVSDEIPALHKLISDLETFYLISVSVFPVDSTVNLRMEEERNDEQRGSNSLDPFIFISKENQANSNLSFASVSPPAPPRNMSLTRNPPQNWLKMRSSLDQVRKRVLQESSFEMDFHSCRYSQTQKYVTASFIYLLKLCVDEAITQLGSQSSSSSSSSTVPCAPCKYCFVGLGATSRFELCPSDEIEFGILVETRTAQVENYFKQLTNLVAIKIANFGETEPNPKGFSLCEQNSPLKKPELIVTPQQMIRFHQNGSGGNTTPTNNSSSSNNSNSNNSNATNPKKKIETLQLFRDVSLIFGDSVIAETFSFGVREGYANKQANPSEFHRSLRDLLSADFKAFEEAVREAHVESWSFDARKVQNAQHLARLSLIFGMPSVLVADLSLFFALSENATTDRVAKLSEKGIFSPAMAKIIQQAIEFAAHCKLQMYSLSRKMLDRNSSNFDYDLESEKIVSKVNKFILLAEFVGKFLSEYLFEFRSQSGGAQEQEEEYSVLHFAARHGNAKLLNFLHENLLDAAPKIPLSPGGPRQDLAGFSSEQIEAENKYAVLQNPLAIAVRHKHLDAVRFLIETKSFSPCDPSIDPKDSIIVLAANTGSVPIMNYLLSLQNNNNNPIRFSRESRVYALNTCCVRGFEQIAKLLVEKSWDNQVGAAGSSEEIVHGIQGIEEIPLVAASRGGNISLVKYLISNWVDVNKANGLGVNPLIAACESNKPETVKLLLESGAQIHQANIFPGGNSPLHLAAKRSSPELLNILLPFYGDAGGVDVLNNLKQTPLFVLCLPKPKEDSKPSDSKTTATVKPTSNSVGKSLISVIPGLSRSNQNQPETNKTVECARLLMVAGADPNFLKIIRSNDDDDDEEGDQEEKSKPNEENGECQPPGDAPIHIACTNDEDGAELVSLMISKFKAKMDLENAEGNTPFHVAVLHEKRSVLKALIKCSNAVKAANAALQTMLNKKSNNNNNNNNNNSSSSNSNNSSSSSSSSSSLVPTTSNNQNNLNPVFDVNIKRKSDQRSPLHVIVEKRKSKDISFEYLKFLILECKCDPNSKDERGDTPLLTAVMNADVKCVRFLLDYGANPNIGDENGSTPLIRTLIVHEANRQVKESLLKTLVEFGADPMLADSFGECPLKMCQEDDSLVEILSKKNCLIM